MQVVTSPLKKMGKVVEISPFKGGGLKWVQVVVSNIVYFHPYLGKMSNLTHIFKWVVISAVVRVFFVQTLLNLHFWGGMQDVCWNAGGICLIFADGC